MALTMKASCSQIVRCLQSVAKLGTMRSISEHFDAVMAYASPVPTPGSPETTPVDQGLIGTVLAADVTATLSVPPWDNSAMDGFILHRADLQDTPFTLPVSGDVAAGDTPQDLPAGTALRIMTGATVPAEGDLLVVPVEDTNIKPGPQELPDTVTINRTTERAHIRRAGENVQPGDIVAHEGTRVDAAVLASLISAGVTDVTTHRPVLVGLVSSGDELVDSNELQPGQLPNSNRPMLEALVCATCPGAVVTHMHCADSPEEVRRTFKQLAANHELIITSGGVSAGAYDAVRAVLTENAQQNESDTAWFEHVAQKPGAPQGLSTFQDRPVFSLPGNPVAAFMSFHLYLAPLLRAKAGLPAAPNPWARPQLQAVAADDFPDPRGRTGLVPVSLDYSSYPPKAVPFARRLGSHLVTSLAGTEGFAAYDEPVAAGDSVNVYYYF